MNQKMPTWTRLEKRVIWDKWVRLINQDVVLPDGSKSTYLYEDAIGGAGVMLYDRAKDEILLSHQYRFPLDRWIYDMPGGLMNEGEVPEQAAIRECQEEVGLTPVTLQFLRVVCINPTRVNWLSNLFFCDDWTESPEMIETDPTERVELARLPRVELVQLIEAGKIIDPSTIIAYYTALGRGLFDNKA